MDADFPFSECAIDTVRQPISGIESAFSPTRTAIVMTTISVKRLTQHLLSVFSQRNINQSDVACRQAARIVQETDSDTEAAFLASIAHLPEAERAERI